MLELTNVNVFYGAFHAIKDVTLFVDKGETVALFGPNGHGKTTILGAISGSTMPRSGSIRYKGREIAKIEPSKRVEMGIVHVPQGGHLFPGLTVMENLKLGAYLSRAWRNREQNLKKVFALFPQLELRARQKCSTLSGGERQMVATGRALMSSADFLILDEPTMGLSPKLAQELMGRIVEIKQAGMTMLLVEENLRLLTELADRMYLVENGRIVLGGPKSEVLRDEQVGRVYFGQHITEPGN